jgi:hypothetical protein
MTAVLEFLAHNGPMLAGGASALLAIGVLLALACRAPLHRQRVCETTVACALAWVVLACVPMPRVEWRDSRRIVPAPMRAMALSNAATSRAPVKIAVADIPPELVAKLSDPPVQHFEWARAKPAVAPRSIDVGRWLAAAWLVGAAACGDGGTRVGRRIGRSRAGRPSDRVSSAGFRSRNGAVHVRVVAGRDRVAGVARADRMP